MRDGHAPDPDRDQVDGTPVPDDGTIYTLATTDFTNTGGDAYFMLKDGQGVTRDRDANVSCPTWRSPVRTSIRRASRSTGSPFRPVAPNPRHGHEAGPTGPASSVPASR